jgi:hypothetical protein
MSRWHEAADSKQQTAKPLNLVNSRVNQGEVGKSPIRILYLLSAVHCLLFASKAYG